MIIDVKEATTTSNVPKGNSKKMVIDAEGMQHIMGLLTNLYKDPELAVIREYYTNALDAHAAAGVMVPVNVTLPTWDEPVYIVQDFGVGMSEWDIENVYSQYGASTKRNTNNQVGAFGLGCKSAFAISNQFTVISVKNGEKCTTLFAKDSSGAYEATVVSKVATDEGNGTTVKIPVRSSIYSFNDKAFEFFKFSDPGVVLVDGQKPENALDGSEKIVDEANPDKVVYLRPKGDGRSYLIMGNVPYELSRSEVELSLSRTNNSASMSFLRMPKYIPAPIGSVDLTPSREGLRFTDKTNELIDTYIKFLIEDMQRIAQEDIDKAETVEDFWVQWRHWKGMVGLDPIWKGKKVPTEISTKEYIRTIFRSTYGNSSHSESQYLRIDNLNNYVDNQYIVTGYSADKYKKINPYLTPFLSHHGKHSGTFLITESDLANDEWIKLSKKFTVIEGDELIKIGREQRKAERKAAATTPGKRDKVKYPVVFPEDAEIRWVDYDEIAEDAPYIQLSEVSINGNIHHLIKSVYGYQTNRDLDEEVAEYFQSVSDAEQIILLNNSRTVEALEKRVKKTTSLNPDVKAAASKIASMITDEVSRHHALSKSGWRRFLKDTGLERLIGDIKDTNIVHIVKPEAHVMKAYEDYITASDALGYFGYHNITRPTHLLDEKSAADPVTKALDTKYPLIGSINTWSLTPTRQKHIIKYLNAVHEEELDLAASV